MKLALGFGIGFRFGRCKWQGLPKICILEQLREKGAEWSERIAEVGSGMILIRIGVPPFLPWPSLVKGALFFFFTVILMMANLQIFPVKGLYFEKELS